MADIVSAQKRSQMMASIKAKNTKPEIMVRKTLHAMGFRFRLHDKRLPGKPDLVLPKYHAVIFVHGCFWHGHGCHLFKWPKSREAYWRRKIEGNRERDETVIEDLFKCGWRVLTVWECALKGKLRMPEENFSSFVSKWLLSDQTSLEIEGGAQ